MSRPITVSATKRRFRQPHNKEYRVVYQISVNVQEGQQERPTTLSSASFVRKQSNPYYARRRPVGQACRQ